VYDVGDIDARPFLTMEYIDGEDLASLLRRIGKLPAAKALEVARQLCAGLAAAHDKGLLHRDLKPANVMIDGRGQARITDFGLAAPAATGESPVDQAGTLAYMAPERFEGKPATVQSDLYALGLILYETYTGEAGVQGGLVPGVAAGALGFDADEPGGAGLGRRAGGGAGDPALPGEGSDTPAEVGIAGGGGAAGRRPAGGRDRGGRDAIA
jgi:serine/threonine protein kinase